MTGDPNCESPPKRGGFADHSTSLFFANFNNSRVALFKGKRIHLNECTTKTKLLGKKNKEAKPKILRSIESDPSKCHSSYIFESNSNNQQCEKPINF